MRTLPFPRLPLWRTALVAGLALLLAPAALLFAQGPLTPPPGVPVATMKRLDEVEARTIVNAANCPPSGSYAFSIAPAQFPSGGSFYLTGNLVIPSNGGIFISASNVTLDLNGFSLIGGPSASLFSGIFISGKNVTITGGGITGAAFSTGINSGVANTRVSGVSVSGTGVGGGIVLTGAGALVQGSTVNGTGGIGIQADAVSDSTATATASTAIVAKSTSNVSGTTTGSGPAVIVNDPLNRDGGDVRTPIPGGTAAYTIAQSGSYYLTGNLSVSSGNAITIAADQVTLDLNGFNLTSTSNTASGDAININGRNGIQITNGTILSGSTVNGSSVTAGSGFVGGVNWGSAPTNIRVSRLTVIGVSNYAIDLGIDGSSVVENCTVRIAGSLGIRAGSVSDSSALQSAGPISATVIANCTGSTPGGSLTPLNTLSTALSTVQTGVTTTNATLTNLQQTVGSRTAIPAGTASVTIDTSGSYYLTGNLVVSAGNGISINASNVTLDLNGYTISSTSASSSGFGVYVTANNIRIHNGKISGTRVNDGGTGTTFTGGGFTVGIGDLETTSPIAAGIEVEAVQVTNVGDGIFLAGKATVVTKCTVSVVSAIGIRASVVTGCAAETCGKSGILCGEAVYCHGSTVSNTPTDFGIAADIALNCRGTSFNNGSGLTAVNATNCYGDSSGTATASRGLKVTGTASYCFGRVGFTGTGTALEANIAIGCSFTNGSATIMNRYLMP